MKKKMTKQFLSKMTLWCVITFLACSTNVLNAQTSGECGSGLTWTLTGSGSNLTLTISKTGTGTGAMTDFTFNSSTQTTNTPWNSQSGNIKTLVLQDGITSIGDNAFRNYGNFTGNLTIPNSVTSVGTLAFYGCSGFTGNLTIPNSVILIDDEAFEFCSGFNGNLSISNSVTSIGNAVFKYCTHLTGNLTIPNSVTSIGFSSFANCYNITGLTIPNSVTSIGGSAFSSCNSLTGNLIIPNSVTSIGTMAFYNCSGFTGLTIPNSVTSINDYAFSGCGSLTSITCLNPVPSKILLQQDVFRDVNKTMCILKVPVGSESAYSTAAQWKDFINIVGNTTAIENVFLQNLKFYPNPAKNELIIENCELRINQIEVVDLSGKIVNREQYNGKCINVSALSQGIYFLKIETNNGIVTKKFIKE